VPRDKTLYFKQEQDIPASFIGSLRYNDRAIYCSYLQECLKDVLITGGQREKKFPPEDYASLIRRSKIGINFSASPAGFWQTKGRIFEILASGSMLVESANPSTRLLFEPNKEYIEFYSPEDLVEKVKYYMTHENERLAIAEAGYQAFQQKYTSKIFWDTIMNKINP
jgi:spore maturation protein CgeB